MKILLSGHGRMGQLIEQMALDANDEIIGFVDEHNSSQLQTMGKADVVMDFSHPAMLPHLEAYIRRTGAALCSGTTGYGDSQLNRLRQLSDAAPVLHSANYSYGIAILRKVLQQISPLLSEDFDIELIEAHHNQKADAPSGTAKLLLESIDPEHTMTEIYGRQGMCGQRPKKEIGVLALRGGTVAGEHTVYFLGEDEILSLTHSAASRKIFARGALKAARALCGKSPGLYTLDQILF